MAALAALAILSAILLPSLGRSRARAVRLGCISNQQTVGIAMRVFAMDNDDRFSTRISTNQGGSAEWASLPNGAYGHFLALSNELTSPAVLRCPTDERKLAESNFTRFASLPETSGGPDAALSYFVGLDGDATEPSFVLLGDRNIVSPSATPPRPNPRIAGVFMFGARNASTNELRWTDDLHRNAGNFTFADGSVQRVSPRQLVDALARGANATNRLHFPGGP